MRYINRVGEHTVLGLITADNINTCNLMIMLVVLQAVNLFCGNLCWHLPAAVLESDISLALFEIEWRGTHIHTHNFHPGDQSSPPA